MFLLFRLCLFASTVTASNLFRGMEDLDQDLEEDIVPDGNVAVGQLPYVAAVFNGLRKFQTCSGVIVTEKVVLTAGYCVSTGNDVVDPFYVSILAGVIDMRDHNYDQWRYAERIVTSNMTYRGVKALVLIKVSSSFFINYTLKVINYQRRKHSANGLCTGVTWRFHDRLDRVILKSLVLKQYPVHVLNQTQCQSVYSGNPILTGLIGIEYFCMTSVGVGRPGEIKHDCMGVDGSLVFCEDSRSLHPAGIATSFVGGSMCNRLSSLFAFYDVGAYHKWMDEEISRLADS